MKKVLIIEDDEDTLELLGLIAKDAGVDIVLRSKELPVLEIERIRPDLIILDHWLGTKFGGDLCFEIKANEATKDIPVILISAVPNIGQIAMDRCADGSISKPFDVDIIQEAIEAYV